MGKGYSLLEGIQIIATVEDCSSWNVNDISGCSVEIPSRMFFASAEKKRWKVCLSAGTCLNCVFSIGFVTEYWLPIWNATSNRLKTLWTSHFRVRLQVIHLFEEPLGKTQRRSTRLLWLTRESTDYQQNQQIVLVLCLHWVRTAFSSRLLSKGSFPYKMYTI